MGYDLILLSAILLFTLVAPHTLIGIFTQRLATPLVLWAHLFVILLIYFAWFWSYGGQTLAMKTWRVRLVSTTGIAPRPAQALFRYLLCWPSFGCGGIGIFWALFDREGQFLHDRIAGTQLIQY